MSLIIVVITVKHYKMTLNLSAPIKFGRKVLLKNEFFTLFRTSDRHFSLSRKNNMRYVQYRNKNGGQPHLGAQLSVGGDIFDISSVDSTIPNNLVDFLKLGQSTYEKARR